MNISKDNVFKIQYTSVLGNYAEEKRKCPVFDVWRNFIKSINENKIISMVLGIFVIFFCLNIALIYNFIDILENM